MTSRPRLARSPALAAWQKCVGDTPPSRWTYDDLWRAAMAEMEASENKDNPEHERHFQREAIALLLGEPVHNVRLNAMWTRRYVARLAELVRKAAA